MQVSWIICDKKGNKIREQNHYVNNNDFEISRAAVKVHGLTKEFLQRNGKPRSQLLQLLTNDLLEFQPMVIGHFMELDYHIIGADYWREGMENPLEKLSTFCIMKATRHLQQNPYHKFLRLGELYQLLFKQPLLNQHNAMTDATATADCFFELINRNEISSFEQPAIVFPTPRKTSKRSGWLLLLILICALLIASYYG